MCQLWNSLKKNVHPMSFRKRRATGYKPKVPDHQESGREKFCNAMCKAGRIQAMHRATDCISEVSRHQETGRTRFQSGFNFAKEACLSGEPPTQPRIYSSSCKLAAMNCGINLSPLNLREMKDTSQELEWTQLETHQPGSAATGGGGMGTDDTT